MLAYLCSSQCSFRSRNFTISIHPWNTFLCHNLGLLLPERLSLLHIWRKLFPYHPKHHHRISHRPVCTTDIQQGNNTCHNHHRHHSLPGRPLCRLTKFTGSSPNEHSTSLRILKIAADQAKCESAVDRSTFIHCRHCPDRRLPRTSVHNRHRGQRPDRVGRYCSGIGPQHHSWHSDVYVLAHQGRKANVRDAAY